MRYFVLLALVVSFALPVKAADLMKSQFSLSEVLDLTHVLEPGIPEFFGNNNAFEYHLSNDFEKDGFRDGHFSMPEHLGTHMDAPCHFAKGSTSIDNIEPDHLVLPCVVIDVSDEVKANPDYCLTVEKVKDFEAHGDIPTGAAVLLNSGWGQRWQNSSSYRNPDVHGILHSPGFGLEAAEYLLKAHHVAALGIDTLSIDPGNSRDFPVHTKVLPKIQFFIENLAGLDRMPARDALLVCAPLRIKNGTGSPARIFALLP